MSESEMSLFSISFRHLIAGTVFLPFLGFIVCVTQSILTKSSTYTHCEVANFAPSISAAIGSEPQKYLWQTCIALHSAPRFVFARLVANHLYDRISLNQLKKNLILFSLALQYIENSALIILSIVTSQENFPVHKTAFSTFIGCSFFYMLILVWLQSRGGYSPQNVYEKRAMTYRMVCFKITLLFASLMIFFYWRHNTFCEPYVYSLFCICEYVCVLANMAFHFMAYFDFYASDVIITKSGRSGYQPLRGVEATH